MGEEEGGAALFGLAEIKVGSRQSPVGSKNSTAYLKLPTGFPTVQTFP